MGNVPPLPTPLDPFLAATYGPEDAAASRRSRLLPPLSLVLDTRPTPASLHTSTKTSRRTHYDAARARAGLAPMGGHADVVLWDGEGAVTETSVRNVAVWREGGWVTPEEGCGCLEGVARRWLVERGVVRAGTVRREDVRVGEWMLVFNAVEGCRLGVVQAGL
ncbi:aminotransferase [Amylostereum chailletii]|nr:aminotransferase [Amylostereum chailletii]